MAIVYTHTRNDTNQIFYVGIGLDIKRSSSFHHRSRHWLNIVKRHGYTINITHNGIIWEEAVAIEKYLISFYGRRDLNTGILVNQTDGGDGVVNISLERRAEMSIKMKQNFRSNPDRSKKIAEANRERMKDPNKKAAAVAYLDKYRNMEDVNKKKRIAIQKKWEDPEFREMFSKRISDNWKLPEFRAKQDKRIKDLLEKPGTLEAYSKRAKEMWENPEMAKRLTDKMFAQWESNEFREKILKGRKDFWSDPVKKALMVEKLTHRMRTNHPKSIKLIESVSGDIFNSYKDCALKWNVSMEMVVKCVKNGDLQIYSEYLKSQQK